jgi:hypothetical protein
MAISPHLYAPDYQAMGDCLVCGHGPEAMWHNVKFSNGVLMRLKEDIEKVWFKLPLQIRQRWWDETKFGKQEPGDELKEILSKFTKESK